MQQTTNYNLPQFAGTDLFNKEDFNDAFNKIDTAISDLQETINNATGNAGVTAQEVIRARKGKASLEEKIGDIDTNVENLKNKSLELQGELEKVNSSLEHNVQQLTNKINEVATTGTTIETVQNKVEEMAEQGLIQAYTLGDNTVEPKKTTFIEIESSINLFDKTQITIGYYYNKGSDGNMTLVSNDSYNCIKIEIDTKKSYSISGCNYTIFFTDLNSNVAKGRNYPTGTTLIPNLDQFGYSGIINAYISFSPSKFNIDTYMIVEGTSLPEDYVPYYINNKLSENIKVDYDSLTNIPTNLKVNEIYTVGKGKDFSTFTACIKALKDNHNNKVIYIDGGEYNIFEEIGGSEFALNIAESTTNWREVSDIIPNNTKIIGLGEVILKFYPSTSEISTQGAKLLSCLNVIYENFYMENVTIICGNCRYGIHDETGGTYIGAVHRYKNVKVYKKSISMGMTQAFGCGFSPRQLLEFDSCHFEGSRYPFSCHNNGSEDVDNAIINAKNTIFNATSTNINSIRFGNVNGKQVKVSVNLTNCYIKNKIQVVNETSTTERPNAFDITLSNCNDTQVEVLNATNIYEPKIFR